MMTKQSLHLLVYQERGRYSFGDRISRPKEDWILKMEGKEAVSLQKPQELPSLRARSDEVIRTVDATSRV